MAASSAGRDSAQRGRGFLVRLTAWLKWHPGRYEVAPDSEASGPQPFEEAQAEPEHIHHPRFSPKELDECIEHSLTSGEADLYAALKDSWSGDFDAAKLRLKGRKARPTAPERLASEDKAFGGDLYPTSAHTTGDDVRFVKVATWSQKQKPVEGAPPKPSAA